MLEGWDNEYYALLYITGYDTFGDSGWRETYDRVKQR